MSEAARLTVRGTWWFASRQFWVVYGDIEAGEIRMGMMARMGDGFEAPVEMIESMLMSGTSHVALGFRPRSGPELERWRGLAWDGRVMEIATDTLYQPCPCCTFRTLPPPGRGSTERCLVCEGRTTEPTSAVPAPAPGRTERA
jgi:hypothetical protein